MSYGLCNSVVLYIFCFDSQMWQEERAIWGWSLPVWLDRLSLAYDSGDVQGSDFLPWYLCFHCTAGQRIPRSACRSEKCVLFQEITAVPSSYTHLLPRMLSAVPRPLLLPQPRTKPGLKGGDWSVMGQKLNFHHPIVCTEMEPHGERSHLSGDGHWRLNAGAMSSWGACLVSCIAEEPWYVDPKYGQGWWYSRKARKA